MRMPERNGDNGVARIFFGGGQFSVISARPTRFGGGGVVAEIFRIAVSLADSVGGGGSSRNCWTSPIAISQPHSVGGVVGEFFL